MIEHTLEQVFIAFAFCLWGIPFGAMLGELFLGELSRIAMIVGIFTFVLGKQYIFDRWQ